MQKFASQDISSWTQFVRFVSRKGRNWIYRANYANYGDSAFNSLNEPSNYGDSAFNSLNEP